MPNVIQNPRNVIPLLPMTLRSAISPIRLFMHIGLWIILITLGACTPRGQQRTPNEPPYFASLRPDEAWGRRGPSYDQPVLWEYQRSGLPLLVIDETPFWRQVLDHEGVKVWMHKSLLSTRPTALIVAEKPVAMFRAAGDNETVIAYIQPNVIVRLGACIENRCQVRKEKIRGFVEKKALWGVKVPSGF